jgi:hypothetical protein
MLYEARLVDPRAAGESDVVVVADRTRCSWTSARWMADWSRIRLDLAGDARFGDIATNSDVSNFYAHSSDRNVSRCPPTVPSSTGTCRYGARRTSYRIAPGSRRSQLCMRV